MTRIGNNSTVVLCGDIKQSDLHPTRNGLAWALAAHRQRLVHHVGLTEFTSADTVRSELCRMWAEAFDALEQNEDPDPGTGVRRTLRVAAAH